VRRVERYDMLEAVIIVLLILAAITAGAQPTGDGVSLLRQVSEAARSAKGWRAEGAAGAASITVSTRGPLEMRFSESRDPWYSSVTICDGSIVWIKARYSGPVSFHADEDGHGATAKACSPAALQRDALLDSLQVAVLAGKDNALGCALVRAEYAVPTSSDNPSIPAYRLKPVAREICVDETSKAILWERFYAGPYVVSLTKIERDPEFGPDEFEIPPNARLSRLEIIGELPVHDCLGSPPSVGCGKNPFALHDGN
jgi:hypothetical protein